MKKLMLASVGMGVLALAATSADAADIIRRRPPPPAPIVVAPPYNWTGLYVGINGGGGFGHSTVSNAFGSTGMDVSGGLVGGTLGYNYQTGPWVFGIEGDGDWSGIEGSTSSGICAGASCNVRNDWLATLRGRVGYAYGRFLPYVTGGAAFGDIKTSVSGFSGSTTDKVGWTLGGGVEAALSGPWTAKLEYLYVDLGDATCGAANCGVSTTSGFHTNIVRVGINYRF
jgi:outer membrane immunogenic protein